MLTGCRKRRAWVSKAVTPSDAKSPWTVVHIEVFVLARDEACNTGQALLQKKYMVSVHGCGQKDGSFGTGVDTVDTLYRLLEDDPRSALNAGQTATCSPIRGM